MSLNTLGVGSGLAGRYAVIGAETEAGDADVACFQEVISWWHLRLLARRMRSFRHVSYRAAPPGPAGGLVTFSRRLRLRSPRAVRQAAAGAALTGRQRERQARSGGRRPSR
jgi:hypothetical protein